MKTLRWFVFVLLLAALSGCGTLSGPDAGPPDDEQLADDVQGRLRDDGITARYAFGVDAENGVVTLRGAVPNDMVRARAIGIALGTPGVVEVSDEIRRR